MLYARVIRPPSRGADLIDLETDVTTMPGVVEVVRDGNFLGVIAEREEVAIRAAERLRAQAKWDEMPSLPDEDKLAAFLTAAPAQTSVLAESGGRAGVPPVNRSIEATFHRPFIAHAAMGPSSATALVTATGATHLEVWTHSQGVYMLSRELARAFDLAEDQITVRHVKGSGCYGHNGADDAAMDAALLAWAVPGRPVQVVWSRQDELTWAPFGPASVVRIVADVATGGDVLRLAARDLGQRPRQPPGYVRAVGLLAASHREGGQEIETGPEPPLEWGGGAGRNAVPGYAFPAHRVVNHQLSVMPLRTSSMRALGGFVNVFAIESFMDELA